MAELSEQLIERNQKLSKILEVGKIMSTHKDLDSLLVTIITETSHILDADRTSLFIYDESHQELWLRVSEKQEINEIRFGIDKGIAGYVARTKEFMNINNAYNHEFFNPEIDQKTGFKTKNLLSAPMENLQGKLIGVIQVLNKKSGAFTKEDEEVLAMFASLAAILLENSILAEDNLTKERLSVVGNMASSIIHDIKNPITSIKGLAEIIAMGDSENQEHAKVILKSVNRIMTMTEELLDFSKGIEKSIQFEKVNCQNFFSEIFSSIEQSLNQSEINFKFSFHSQGNFEINQDKIQRAIYNISGNAQDAMESSGTLSINVKDSDDGNNIIILISDTGKGMPKNIQETLFEPFITYGKKNGTGLGMAITKKIIDMHKGSISVESKENVGTQFEIILPKHQTSNTTA